MSLPAAGSPATPGHGRMLTAALLFVALSTGASASTLSPVAVTGYNYGGIVPNTAVPPYASEASSLDLDNDALFQSGLPATTGGLPVSGLLDFASGPTTYDFTLGPYGGLNLLRINPAGTLSLSDPMAYSTIAVLGFSTQNNQPGAVEMVGDATLHFSDGSSTVYAGAVDLSDWFAATPLNPNVVTSAAGGLVNITSPTAASAFQPTSGGPDFYVSVIALTPTDAAKNLTAVSFGDFPFGGNSFQFVMALDGETGPIATPEPSGFELAAAAMLLLGVRAAMSRRALKSQASRTPAVDAPATPDWVGTPLLERCLPSRRS